MSKDVVESDCKTNSNNKGVFGRAHPLGLLCLLRNGFDSSFFTQKRFEMAPHAKPFRRVPLE